MKTVVDSLTLPDCLNEIKANCGLFYVYVLSRADGSPFYIGCGLARGNRHERIQDHAMYARSGQRSHKSNLIRKLWRGGDEIRYAVDSWHSTEASVFAREMELIELHGRAESGGVLLNGNAGGTGQFRPSDEIRRKMSETKRRNGVSEAERKRRRDAQSERMKDPARIQSLREAALKQWDSAEAKAKRSITSRRLWSDPEYRERLSKKHKDRCVQPEAIEEFKRRLAPKRSFALAKSAEVRRADGAWKVKIAETKRAAAKVKYEIRSRCIAAGGSGLPDHRANLAAWVETARSLGVSLE